MSSDLSLQPRGCQAKKNALYVQKPWTSVQKRMPVVAEYPTPGPDSMPMCFYIGQLNDSKKLYFVQIGRTMLKDFEHTVLYFAFNFRETSNEFSDNSSARVEPASKVNIVRLLLVSFKIWYCFTHT